MDMLVNYLTLETAAVVFGLLYLILAIRQNVLCWIAGIISTSIYLFVFFNAKLYMESALQIFYIVISLYGIWQWKHAGPDNNSDLAISSWNVKQHCVALTTILGLSLLSTYLLSTYTDAALPFIDSLTTWGGIVATFMVARKIFENWHYWFVIDSVSIFLYLSRDLKQTAFLFAIYLVLIVFGYLEWKRSLLSKDE